jgi:hypothetical protein
MMAALKRLLMARNATTATFDAPGGYPACRRTVAPAASAANPARSGQPAVERGVQLVARMRSALVVALAMASLLGASDAGARPAAGKRPAGKPVSMPFKGAASGDGPSILDVGDGARLMRSRGPRPRQPGRLDRADRRQDGRDRSAQAAAARAEADGFLAQLYRDPAIRAMGDHMRLSETVHAVALGGAFDPAGFQKAARAAARRYLAGDRTGITSRLEARDERQALELLVQKLEVVEIALAAATASDGGKGAGARARGKRGPPRDASREDAPHDLPDIFGPGESEPVALEAVPGARAVAVSPLVGGATEAEMRRRAEAQHGRQLVPADRAPIGRATTATAWKEVGRAVATRPRPLRPGSKVATEDVIKGPGPTRFAENRYNKKATGSFSLQEAQDDWTNSERLMRAGVPVYTPVSIVMLPYLEWHPTKGWKPMGTYTRRPVENLRLPDAGHAGERTSVLMTRLRRKLGGMLADGGAPGGVTDHEVVRFVALRLGRVAGILHRERYFHGMLHDQNVGLLGELVDVGKNDGVQPSWDGMTRAWSRSVYQRWQGKNYMGKLIFPGVDPPRQDDPTTGEAGVLRVWVGELASDLGRGLDGGRLPAGEAERLFDAGFRQGQAGASAIDAVDVMRAARAATRSE